MKSSWRGKYPGVVRASRMGSEKSGTSHLAEQLRQDVLEVVVPVDDREARVRVGGSPPSGPFSLLRVPLDLVPLEGAGHLLDQIDLLAVVGPPEVAAHLDAEGLVALHPFQDDVVLPERTDIVPQ